MYPDEEVGLRLFSTERGCYTILLMRCHDENFFHCFSLWIYDERISNKKVVAQTQGEHKNTARGD